MGQFTVIGMHASNNQIFADFVEANNKSHAFSVSAKKEEFQDADFICALDGIHQEGESISYAGSASVDSETIVSQSDVFC